MDNERDKKWEILSSKYIINNRWLVIRQDSVLLPNGETINDYYVQESPNWIIVIAITEEGKYIIERQYRHGIQKIQYELCGGHIEEGEEPLDAAKRELLEETGYEGGEWSLLMTSTPNPSSMTITCNAFLAKGVKRTGEQRLEATEDIDVMLMDKTEILSLMKNGNISQGDMLAALWRWMSNVR